MPRRVTNRALRASVVITSLMLAAGLSGCGKTESSASLMAEARQYQQKGDNKAALIQLKNAAAKSPEDAEVRFQLASVYHDSDDPVSAEKEIRKAMSLGLDNTRAAPVLAKALLAQGKAKNALEETEAASAKATPELAGMRGDAFLATNQPAKAKEAYESILKAKPDDVTALLGMARYALSQRDVEAASKYLDEAIAKNPKSPEALLFKASFLRAQAKNDEALAAYAQVVALQPGHRTAYIDKANLEITSSKFDAAKADIAAANKNTPGSLGVVYVQALLDYSQGRTKQALEGLQKVLRVAPEHMPSLLLAGSAEFALGTYEQSEQHFRKYLEKDPASAPARQALAALLLKVQRPADAMATLAPLVKNAGDNPRILTLLGQAHLQLREFDKATEYFEKAGKILPNEAALHTALAISKLGQGDSAAAIRELETATKLDPASEEAGIMLATTELRLHHNDKAMAAAKALEKAKPDNPVVHNLKGGIYLELGDGAGAIASFEKALAVQPSYFPAAANLARVAMRDKKPELAKKRLEEFLGKNQKNVQAMSALANLANVQGHREEATTWLERANTENPDSIPTVLELGSHYLQTGQAQKALTMASKYQTANASNADLINLLGQAQLATNNKGGALESYSKLVNLVPKSALAQYRLASVHMMLNNETAAEEDLKKALALQPDYLDAQMLQAQIAFKKGNYDAALAIARQVQKATGKGAVGHILEGDIQLNRKKPDLAIEQYQQAFKTAKTFPIFLKIHHAMAQNGKEKQAEALMTQWQKDNPNDLPTAMLVAETSLAKNQFKEASAQFEAILKRDPKNLPALNNLAWVYQKTNDPRALATADEAYKLAGDRPQIIDTLGWILIEQGNTTRGVPLLQKAVELAPQDRTIRFHLAAGLAKAGDKANARKELEQILAAGNDFSQIGEVRAMLKLL